MGVTREGIVEHATWIANARNGGGTYDPEGFGYPWRIVLHTIEGSANPAVIAGHQYPPHLWYDPATRKLYQTVPLSRSAFALYQASDAPHYTNKARALQVELAGRAAETASWPTEWLNNITEDVVVPMCQWVAQYNGASIDLSWAPDPGPIPGSATEFAPQRVSPGIWAVNSGLYSHRHVPMGDTHWDTGGLDTPRIAAHARLLISGLLAPATQGDEDDMPDYLLQANDTRTVVARYPQGAVKQLSYHELMYLVNEQKIKVIATDQANLNVILAD
jgi:hypothetical protein